MPAPQQCETVAVGAGRPGPAPAASSIRCPFTSEPIQLLHTPVGDFARGAFWSTVLFPNREALLGFLDSRSSYPLVVRAPLLRCPFTGEKLQFVYSDEQVAHKAVGPHWYTTWFSDLDQLKFKLSYRDGNTPQFSLPIVCVSEPSRPPPANPVADQIEAAHKLKDRLAEAGFGDDI